MTTVSPEVVDMVNTILVAIIQGGLEDIRVCPECDTDLLRLRHVVYGQQEDREVLSVAEIRELHVSRHIATRGIGH